VHSHAQDRDDPLERGDGGKEMKTAFSAFAVGGLLFGSVAQLGCGNTRDNGGVGSVSNALVATAAAAERGNDDREKGTNRSADSSPFVVGVWKFVNTPNGPTIDTEFRFINPTTETLTLEYAFFELDGTFCGCDRDDFPPNKTTEYTMLDESQLQPPLEAGPRVFSCSGTSGALKSIVFKNKGQHIFLDEAAQVGFQTHAFGQIMEGDASAFLTGTVMTAAPLQGIALTDSTLNEIRAIHQQCVTVNGEL
jgi:hypothetical protein